METSSTDNLTLPSSPFIIDGFLHVPVAEIAGRMAARAFAYSKIAEGLEELADIILDIVGEAD